MKRFDIQKGKAVIYINQQDLDTLRKLKKFVSPDLFQEDSILKDKCDEEEYYIITNLVNVNYIRSLGFIPHYNYLLKFGSTELEEMLDNALNCLNNIDRVIAIPCDQYTTLSEEEISFLRSIKEVESSLIEMLISKDPRDELEWLDIMDIASAIRTEYMHYTRSLEQMLEYKEGITSSHIKQNSKEQKKRAFLLKRLFESICK